MEFHSLKHRIVAEQRPFFQATAMEELLRRETVLTLQVLQNCILLFPFASLSRQGLGCVIVAILCTSVHFDIEAEQ